MSLKLNASGGGSVTLQEPSTASNFVLNLPAVTGTIATTENIPTPAALSTASGSAPSYSARAWVNFNGTGTVAIRGSGNVSSITDNGTGLYTVNFTIAMPNANYSVTLAPRWESGVSAVGAWTAVNTNGTSNITTTSVAVLSASTGGSIADSPFIGVSIFS